MIDSRVNCAKWASLTLAMLVPGFVTWMFFVGAPGGQSTKFLYSFLKIFMLVFPGLAMLVLWKNKVRLNGPSKSSLRLGLGLGVLMGAGILTVFFFIFEPMGLFDQTSHALKKKLGEFGVSDHWTFISLAAFICLVNSTLEEYYWRWFVFGGISQLLNPVWAIVLSSGAFVLHHQVVIGHYMNDQHYFTFALFFSLCVGAAGAVWAWIYHKTGDLWAAWISHLVADVAIMVIGYRLMF